jgi:4,5-dihydroxyphthalate decarboxylase
MAGPPVLSFACAFSDRVEALLDGRVAVEGFDLDIQIRQPQAIFRAVLRDQAYDIAEMSIGSHVANIGAGRDDYVGLPIFLSRAFRHSNLYVRTDRIVLAQDLIGKTVGVIDYQQTAALWVRGFLTEDHGVPRESLSWVAGGLNAPVAEGRAPPPPGVRLRRTDETLDALLRRGEIDAVISPVAPHGFVERAPNIGRLFPDPQTAEIDYHRRTGLFPLMHCVVVRRTLIKAYPDLASALYRAFETARRLALADLDDRDYPKVALPWLTTFRRQTIDVLGGEAWTYGLEGNAREISALLAYALADGLIDHPLAAQALFVRV